MKLSIWLQELKRRRVFRALVTYAIAAFAILQVIEPVMHGLALPEWVLKAVVIGLGLGLPVTLLLAWAYDISPRGIERTPAPAGVSARSCSSPSDCYSPPRRSSIISCAAGLRQ